jgi:hypothetical protein
MHFCSGLLMYFLSGVDNVTSSERSATRCLSVPRQHKVDSLERLRKREFLAHFNRGRSGDEIESGAAIGGSGEGGTGYPAGDPAAVLSGGKGPDRDRGSARLRQRR